MFIDPFTCVNYVGGSGQALEPGPVASSTAR